MAVDGPLLRHSAFHPSVDKKICQKRLWRIAWSMLGTAGLGGSCHHQHLLSHGKLRVSGEPPGAVKISIRVSGNQTDYQGVNIYSNPSDFLTATQVSSPWQNSLNYLDYFPGTGHAALPTRKYYINSTNIYVRCSVDINIISIFRYIIHRDDILL